MNKTIFNLNDLAEYTGISKSYLYKLTHLHKIPFSKPFGKLIFFDKNEIDQWLLSNKQKTEDQLEVEANTFVTLKSKGGRNV